MHLQTINGATYQYDPAAGVVFYGEADAADFQHVNGVALLADCGCRAETGCRCRQKIERMTTAAALGSRTIYHHTVAPPAPAAPTATCTSPDLVRRLVAEKRAEMRAQEIERRYHGSPVERRLANEAARAYKHAVSSPIPRPYDKPAEERRALDLLKEAHR